VVLSGRIFPQFNCDSLGVVDLSQLQLMIDHIERQVLFLLAANEALNKNNEPCWVIKKCPMTVRKNCPAWELQVGQLCWFINGTICEGKVKNDWTEKMQICRKCKVFKSMIPFL